MFQVNFFWCLANVKLSAEKEDSCSEEGEGVIDKNSENAVGRGIS